MHICTLHACYISYHVCVMVMMTGLGFNAPLWRVELAFDQTRNWTLIVATTTATTIIIVTTIITITVIIIIITATVMMIIVTIIVIESFKKTKKIDNSI